MTLILSNHMTLILSNHMTLILSNHMTLILRYEDFMFKQMWFLQTIEMYKLWHKG
jgi:hypothetical protein